MPWDKAKIAKYPRLIDQSPAGQRLLHIAQKAFAARNPGIDWDNVNPEMRDWWVRTAESAPREAGIALR